MVRRTLGHYRIEAQIGAGGMGEVYLARDTRLDRRVALKLLPSELTRRPDWVRRLRQEARTASGLNHPNIVTVHEIGRAAGIDYIASEFIEGETLRRRLASGPLALRDALDIATQVAGALAAAHDARIVHRDIKPENIMIRRDGYVKVLDFGVARPLRLTAEADSTTQTLVREIKGTPRYMSPEQLLGQRVDVRSDIFSLGVAMFEMLAGRPPFGGDDGVETAASILTQRAPVLATYARVPAEMERIVRKSLERRPEERYQSARDLLLDLKNLGLELELQQRPRDASDLMADRPRPTRSNTRDGAGATPMTHITPFATLDPIGGAVPLHSKFYVERPADAGFAGAIERGDSIVLVKGPRQVGKTSLLARGLQAARRAGTRVVLTDFQKLNASQLATPEALYLALAQMIADQIDLDFAVDNVWDTRRGPSINFERFLRRGVLRKLSSPMVWGLDEVDRLFGSTFASEVFGLFRSWHNERSLDPTGPWQRLTLAMAYATEAHLFITDLNQSPFNVGTRLLLNDFSVDEVAELNRRYGSPLATDGELRRYVTLVGGQPYLVHCGLHDIVTKGTSLTALESSAADAGSPFADHLRRILASVTQDDALKEAVRGVLQGQTCQTSNTFHRLCSAGILTSESADHGRLRCGLYRSYLERNLL